MDGECIDIQEKILRIQLDIARQYKRPVSIHCRSDWARLLSILDSVGDLPGGFMIHCFGGSFEIANELLNRELIFLSLERLQGRIIKRLGKFYQWYRLIVFYWKQMRQT